MGVADLERSGAHKVLVYDHELEHLSTRKLKYITDDDEKPARNSKKIQKRSRRIITNICVGPSCFDFMDDILLFSLFRQAHVYNDRGYKYGASEQVKVKVMVCLVEYLLDPVVDESYTLILCLLACLFVWLCSRPSFHEKCVHWTTTEMPLIWWWNANCENPFLWVKLTRPPSFVP